MRVVGLVSGGKDSWYALHVARDMGWEIGEILTVRPAPESEMFHHPNTEWVPLQAKAAGLKHRFVDVPAGSADELEPLSRALALTKADGFVSGAVASEYQRTRLERIGNSTGLKSFAPLWHKPPLALLSSLVAGAFDARFVHVAARGLDASWLGRRLDAAAVSDLGALSGSKGVHPIGEGGEYETFVLDAPMFRSRLSIERAKTTVTRDTATLALSDVRSVPKG